MAEFMSEYVADLRRCANILDRETERALFRQAKRGDQAARERLIASQLRFAFTLARKFVGQGVMFDDLVSVANLGVVYSVDKFRLKENTRLTTLTYWSVMRRCARYVEEYGSILRLPPKCNLKATTRPFYDTVRAARAVQIGAVYSDLDEHAESDLADQTCDFDEIVKRDFDNTRLARIYQAMDALPGREQSVLYLRFFEAQTLDEVASVFRVTKERIRQIEARAIRRIKDRVLGKDAA